jgi:ion channel POLLUX/CASTOR
MTKNTNWKQRLRYEFDKTMAAGPIALIGWLGLISLVVILVAGAVLALTGIAPGNGEAMDFVEGAWESAMRALDAGTLGGDTGWAFRSVMLLVTLAGIFVVSALIGVLSSGMETKLEDLRKGRSQVLENNHTIILNWSASIFDVIRELTVANESRKRPRIVIMANRDKVEMEDEIAAKIVDTRNTRIICRRGDPTDLYDLAIVNPQTSRSIVVLSPEDDDPDSQVVKTVLALVNAPDRRPAPYQIAAEIRDMKNAELAQVVGGNELQLVLADDLIARIMVQSCRQSGLSGVYSELLDFDGCEIYATQVPDLVGHFFGEALLSFPNCIPIGLADDQRRVELNPPSDRPIAIGEKLLIIAEDDDKIAMSTPIRADIGRIRSTVAEAVGAERTLMIGWNRRSPMVATELSRYVAPGSLLTILADVDDLESKVQSIMVYSDHLAIEFARADTTHCESIERFDIPSYDHVLVLGYTEDLPPQPADTRTLVTLLHLRKIAEKAGRHIGVVSEMIDVRNRELAEVSRADDYVVSNKLVSLMLAQAAENEYMSAIFGSLLDEQGSEIFLRPIGDYVETGTPVTFATLTESARRRGEIALGYRRIRSVERDARGLGGVVINPDKALPVDFERQDRIVVLASS